MSNSTPAQRWVTAAAIGVGGVAMFGSAAALYNIGIEDQNSAAWTLPFCLDAMALVCVCAVVFAGQRNLWVRLGPWLGYGASAVLQWTDAMALGTRPPFTHIAALGAAILLSEVVLAMWHTEDTQAVVVPEAPVVTAPQAVPAAPVRTAVPERSTRPSSPLRPAQTPSRSVAKDSDLLVSLARYRDGGGDMTVRSVASHLSVGKDRAGRLIKALEVESEDEDTRLVVVR